MLSGSTSRSSLGAALECLPELTREALGWVGWALTSWGLVSAALQPIIELTLAVSWRPKEMNPRKHQMSQLSLFVKVSNESFPGTLKARRIETISVPTASLSQ